MNELELISSYNSILESISSSRALQEQDEPQQYLPTEAERPTSPTEIALFRTETVRTLQELGMSYEPIYPDFNSPQTSNNIFPIFPEEYTLETTTGLVPVATLQTLGRTSLAISKTRTRQIGRYAAESDVEKLQSVDTKTSPSKKETLTIEELDPEIEFVTFVTNDPDNPHNWPIYIRWVYTVVLSVLVICVAYGSACIAGGLGTVQDKFNVGSEVAILSVSLMVLGFSFGPLIWSPLSDLYGRRTSYFISMGLYVLFNVPCAVAKNVQTLMISRFFCGVWSSSALCLVGGSIADMFPSDTRGRAIAFFAFAPYCGPVFGPLVNGFIAVSTGRMDLIFWVNMAFAGVMWIVISLIPETFAPVILKRRANKLRKELGNDKIMTEQEAQGTSVGELIKVCCVRPLYFAVTEPVLDLVCLYVCLIYSLLYAFFFAYPVIFGELYGYKDNIIGLMFIPILIGACMALATTFFCEIKYLQLSKRRKPTPEDRLLGAMIGAPFAAIALWILGATSSKHIIWVGPASSGLAFGFGMVLIYYSLNNYIIDCYIQYASSALATKVFLRSAGGAAFPLFTNQMYHTLGLHWASWLLAFIATAMIIIPFSFYYYGKMLRSKLSKRDYSLYSLE